MVKGQCSHKRIQNEGYTKWRLMEADDDENEKIAVESSQNLIQHCLTKLYQPMPALMEMLINDGRHYIKHYYLDK